MATITSPATLPSPLPLPERQLVAGGGVGIRSPLAVTLPLPEKDVVVDDGFIDGMYVGMEAVLE